MPERQLMSGNWALAEGALHADCDAYFGYPITPQNEVTEFMARRMPAAGRIFLQSESELAAISMIMGAAATGKRVMTSSSSPGISLMQEGISYICGCELPCVIANIVRGGPGLGNIGPSQCDYFQAVKGGGHGDYRLCVLAPASVQETFDFVFLAFEIAYEYRNPVMILSDGLTGQMMEPLELRTPTHLLRERAMPAPSTWALDGAAGRPARRIKSLYLGDGVLEAHNARLQANYARIAANEVRYETYGTDDAEFLFVAYGICARVCREAVDRLRAEGVKVGLFRPISLWPFPSQWLCDAAPALTTIMAVELSCGQMVEDVRLAVEGRCPVAFFGRAGGELMTVEDVITHAHTAFALPGRAA